MAYTSDESGRQEIYVRRFKFSGTAEGTGRDGQWQVSNGGGSEPRWRADGRELYFQSREGVMAVAVSTETDFRTGKPGLIGVPTALAGDWDATRDGNRFLVSVPVGKPSPYTVVLNWQAGLKK